MSRMKILITGGLVFLLSSAVFASNGNPRIPSSWPGAGSALVFCNAQPYQNDNASAGSLYLLSAPANYFIDDAAYLNYTKYGVISTPVTTTNGYLLLKDGAGKYATIPFSLGSPVGPADQKIDSVTWYNTDKPDAPSSLAAQKGFETAKTTWQLNPNPAQKRFDYSSIEFTVKKKSDSSIVYATGNVSPTVLGGSSTSSSIGELIDGRKLDSGTEYEVSLVGKVKGKADESVVYSSDPATISFTTLTGGAAVATTETWTFEAPAGKTHINTFAIPFVNLATVSDEAGVTRDISTVGELIAEINRQALQQGITNPVMVFGWYDEATQQHLGLTSIPEGNVVNATPTGKKADGTPYTKDEILNDFPIVTDQPYQVSVNQEVTFKLKGFKQ